MYIYFDENGTIKEVVNDKSIRQGSNEANKLYCYIEGNPSIEDIWYIQKNVDGSLTNEISFKNSTITKAIPYDAKRDMRYFKDFETYTFYVFTLTTNYLKQSGLVSGTIRIEVDNEIFALGELKFNVQENVINTSNGITQSQYDYLLLAYASRTLNEQTGSDLDHLLDEKIDAKIGDIADGSPKVFDTTAHIQALTSDMGVAVATDTGYIWVWSDTDEEYKNTNYVYLANVSAYYTKTEAENTFAKKSANNTFTGENEFTEKVTFFDDIEIGGGDINQTNGSYSTNGNVEAQSITIDGVNLEDMFAGKTATYTISQTDELLDSKADKSNTYTIPETNTLLDGKQNVLTFDSTPIANSTNPVTSGGVKTALDTKADSTTVSGIDNRVGALENEITDLQSVQNVVDVVATKNDLNNYPTSDLEVDDKIQVIADESQGGASTIYNWNGNIWEYVGAFGGNSYTKDETLQQIDLHKLINKTYAELQTMKTNGTLVAGQLYRITDYVTKTNGKCNNIANDVRSTEYPFDIILRAISTTEFSEQARAIWHSGDTYFANSELQAWKLWYCFDNDSTRFEWADTSTGKGVIYRMIDEFGNDLPYDFKNIQFKRYKITATSDQRQALFVGKYLGFSGNYAVVSDNSDYVWYYTFSKRSDGSDLSLTETTASDIANSYYVKQVIIGQYLTDTPNYRGAQALNNIVMEADNIIVDVQMGAGSRHNTWIGNKDIDYCYFREMFRQNILFGEINHTRADECFEQNVLGEGHYSNYSSCWNKFSHHFSRNTALNLQSNDFEGQVGNCKFPEHFTRNFVSNMWDNVNAGTHDTFNRCEFGYMVNVTLSGAGDWDGVKVLMLYNVTLKIANFYGSTVGRMEYVTITEDVNAFNILNLTIGALYGSSSTQLTIALTDLYSYNLTTAYEKRLDYALEPINSLRVLVYSVKVKGTYIVQDKCVVGTINGSTGNVTWALADTIEERIDSVYDGLFNTKMAKQNPTGSGAISMNDGTASGTNSYANGSGATASGMFSKAIGFGAQASGSYSTAIVGNASGTGAIAIGNSAKASGDKSKALGDGTNAKGNNQTVIGKFNIPDTTSLEIVGNGAYMNTKNARVLDGNGNEFLAGDLYLDTEFSKDSNGDLLSKQGMSVKQAIKNIQSALEGNLYNETNANGIAYEVALSNPLPYGKVNKVGGMSYKSENLIVLNDVAETERFSFKYKISNGKLYIKKFVDDSTSSNAIINLAQPITFIANKTYYLNQFNTNNVISIRLLDNDNTSITTLGITANGTFTPTETKVATKIQWFGSGEYNVELVYSPMITENSVTEFKQGFTGIRNTAVSQLTIKGANLLNLSNVVETTHAIGVTYKVQNGAIVLNGTAISTGTITFRNIAYVKSGVTYYNYINDNPSGYVYVLASNTGGWADEPTMYLKVNTSKTMTASGTLSLVLYVSSGTTFTNKILTPMLVKGSTAPTEYKPYVNPIIKTIPSEIQALTGWGWGLTQSASDYLYYPNKKYVQAVNRAKLKDLNFEYIGNNAFAVSNIGIATVNAGTIVNAICNKYDVVAYNTLAGDATLICISGYSSDRIYLRDTNYTDATTLKNSFTDDDYLYYELATPIETDISQYLTDENYDVLPNLEPNGSITLDNTYQQEAVYDITTLEKVSV